MYVWKEDGNALSRTALIEELRFQRTLLESDAVSASLDERGVTGISNLVAARAADAESPDLAAQIDALEAASDDEVEELVAAVLGEDPTAARFLPTGHDASRTVSADRRLVVAFDVGAESDEYGDATEAVSDAAEERSDAGYFTAGQHAFTAYNQHFFGQMAQLVLPVALLVILLVLAFSYRDLVDILVGMTGVVLSVAWMFGIMGWLGVSAGTISLIPAVLITGLSIDFGFHVFNRYREQRGADEGIRDPMSRGTRLVATALVLVTVTAAIGFLSNLANPLPVIRNLEALYDALYAADAEAASDVVELTDGQYRSLLVTLSLDTEWTERAGTVATLETGEQVMERNGLTATVAGPFAVSDALLNDLIGGIVQTMFIALAAIVVVLAVVFRVMHGSATLGAVVAVPIALVIGLVVGAMYLLDLPLNLLTALLMSLVIGLGVDYNSHIGDRFADELREGKSTAEALEDAVTGTGGALLGSTLTSVGAFSALLLVPLSQFRGFATIVVVALLTAFLVSVLVLPSILVLWDRYTPEPVDSPEPTEDVAPQD